MKTIIISLKKNKAYFLIVTTPPGGCFLMKTVNALIQIQTSMTHLVTSIPRLGYLNNIPIKITDI